MSSTERKGEDLTVWQAFKTRLDIRRDPVAWSRRAGVTVGRDCRFLSIDSGTFGSEPYLVTIGSHVTITHGVRFVTHDGGVWVLRDKHPDIDVFGRIAVGDNVFIGLNSLILPGVSIGDNVVVGAGSVVNKDIPSGSVAAGVPARVLGTIDAYEARSLERATMTKSLTAAEKRAYLLTPERFGRDQHPSSSS